MANITILALYSSFPVNRMAVFRAFRVKTYIISEMAEGIVDSVNL